MKRTDEKLPVKGKRQDVKAPTDGGFPSDFPVLLGDIRDLIETARNRVAVGVNVTLLLKELGHWFEDQERYSRERARPIREKDSCDTVATIDPGIWEGI